MNKTIYAMMIAILAITVSLVPLADGQTIRPTRVIPDSISLMDVGDGAITQYDFYSEWNNFWVDQKTGTMFNIEMGDSVSFGEKTDTFLDTYYDGGTISNDIPNMYKGPEPDNINLGIDFYDNSNDNIVLVSNNDDGYFGQYDNINLSDVDYSTPEQTDYWSGDDPDYGSHEIDLDGTRETYWWNKDIPVQRFEYIDDGTVDRFSSEPIMSDPPTESSTFNLDVKITVDNKGAEPENILVEIIRIIVFGDEKNDNLDMMISDQKHENSLKREISKLEQANEYQTERLADLQEHSDELKDKKQQLEKEAKELYDQYMKNREELGEEFDFTVPTGDPGVFSINGNACTVKRELGNHESTYWRFNIFATEPSIPLPMERELCPGTMVITIDWNDNGIVDDGHEILFSQEFNIFDKLRTLDELFGNNDGMIDSDDQLIWKYVHVAEYIGGNLRQSTPESNDITGFQYDNRKQFWDDQYGIGVYADELHVSEEHFRINSWSPYGVHMSDGSTKDLYGAIFAPLSDCTVQDTRYHTAERHTGEYLRVDDPVDPTMMYIDALENCLSYGQDTLSNPDKYISHWIAGIASMEHKKGFTDPAHYDKARVLYDFALKLSPANPFYNVDSCLLEFHMSKTTVHCLPMMNKAIEDRPDVEWFAEARDIVLRGAF